MNKRVRILGQLFIAAFFLWHASSVALYSIPVADKSPVWQTLRSAGNSVFRAYLLTFSQWQQWNLFSPDPLRRVTNYRIDQRMPDGQWVPLVTYTPSTYSFWTHSAHFKLLIGLLEKDQGTYNDQVVAHFAQMQCVTSNLPAGTPLRIVYSLYIIPKPQTFAAAFSGMPWPPKRDEAYGPVLTCP